MRLCTKDYLDLAESLAKLANSLMQALMLTTLGVVGWFVTSDTLLNSAAFSTARVVVAVSYVTFGGFIAIGYNRFIHRAQLAIALARKLEMEGSSKDPDLDQLLSPFAPVGAAFGLPAIIFLTSAIVLAVTG